MIGWRIQAEGHVSGPIDGAFQAFSPFVPSRQVTCELHHVLPGKYAIVARTYESVMCTQFWVHIQINSSSAGLVSIRPMATL